MFGKKYIPTAVLELINTNETYSCQDYLTYDEKDFYSNCAKGVNLTRALFTAEKTEYTNSNIQIKKIPEALAWLDIKPNNVVIQTYIELTH